MTLSCVINFHAEALALPSFIEHAEAFFDEIVFVSSPPAGVEPDEASIEIVKATSHRLVFTDLSQGFGVLRTRCLGESRGDWTVILDADEIMAVNPPRLTCHGTEKYPEVKEPNLTTTKGPPVNQREALRQLCLRADSANQFAVCLSRRHWFDAPEEYNKPCQNWQTIPDWQLRVCRNDPRVFFDPEWRLHEKLLLTSTWCEPPCLRTQPGEGPFFDHAHCFYKSMDVEKNKRDMETYRILDQKNSEGMWLEHQPGCEQPNEGAA